MSSEKEEPINNTRTIHHSASGTKCIVHDFGATVLSFQTSNGCETLFVSRKAKLDGTKAIRGGIPLVFPQFGQPDTTMPQHGFLRNNYWKTNGEIYDTTESAGIEYTLALQDVTNARGNDECIWNEKNATTTQLDCSCTYRIEIGPNTMTTSLTITNTTSSEQKEASFDFQTLQHTYFLVHDGAAFDPKQCYVKGLTGYLVDDKITKEDTYTAGDDPVVLVGNIDRVYTPPPNTNKNVVDVTIGVGGGNTTNTRIQMKATGQVNGTSVPVSCVVWNPYKEKAAAMGDFDDDQYVDMICVEPGILTNTTSLEAGMTANLTQTIQVVALEQEEEP